MYANKSLILTLSLFNVELRKNVEVSKFQKRPTLRDSNLAVRSGLSRQKLSKFMCHFCRPDPLSVAKPTVKNMFLERHKMLRLRHTGILQEKYKIYNSMTNTPLLLITKLTIFILC